jgi:hypothetical protein
VTDEADESQPHPRYTRPMQTRAAAAIALAGVLFGAQSARAFAAEGACSSDTFAVEGSAVVVQVCDAAGLRLASAGSVQETLSVKGRPTLVRSVRYERLANEETARTLDDVPLETLGIAKTMHVTLAIRGGTARIEHVLLVPGALSLK